MPLGPQDHLQRIYQLTREMLRLADDGDRDRNDDSCGILYGILRDSAYRLRRLVVDELRQLHRGTSRRSDWSAGSEGSDTEHPGAEASYREEI
jgi:hypothetical protein